MNSRFENNLDAPIRYVVGIDLGTTNSVMCYVDLEEINDETMVFLARDIARKIENELQYPGQIKVNVIRETRATDIAK